MIQKPINFEIREFVCPDVFNAYGETAWQFFDPKLLQTIDLLRQKLNRKILINTWHEGGSQQESGFRCLKCSIVQDYIKKDQIYCSAHMTGQAVDFSVEGMLAEEVRNWIRKNQNLLRTGKNL
jgi:hypothetical protein